MTLGMTANTFSHALMCPDTRIVFNLRRIVSTNLHASYGDIETCLCLLWTCMTSVYCCF